MAEFQIRGRIDQLGEGFIAKLWLCPADAPEDAEAGVKNICDPCTLDQVRATCNRFIEDVSAQLQAGGHSLSAIRVQGL
jgi:hypothetical protein